MALVIDNKKIESILELVQGSKKVLILAHMNPDGDAIGSMLGLAHLLKRNAGFADEDLFLLLPNVCPENFRFLPGSERIICADTQFELCQKAFEETDLIIGVDFNNTTRIGRLQELVEQSKKPKILIDHHHGPDQERFSPIVSVVDLSSTCELIYWLCNACWGTNGLSSETARCLYTGICTDTGSFAYANESSSLYEAASELVKHDIGPAEIHNEIFNDFSVNRMQFFGYCISERLRIFEDKGFAYFYISQQDQQKFSVKESDTEGLVNYTLMMRNIHVGALVKELKDKVRISFRSKKDFDVNTYARTYFSGGGHTKASGATSTLNFQDTLEKLEETMLEELSR